MTTMRRIVFLDFDGVIMTHASYLAAHAAGPLDRAARSFTEDLAASRMDPELVARVSTLCIRAEADIVLSTSWRGSDLETQHALERALWRRGLDPRVRVVGQTPSLPLVETGPSRILAPRPRGEEIVRWLKDHRPGWTPGRIVVLDDAAFIAPLQGRWVETSFDRGFTNAHLAQALRLLGLEP